MYDQLVKDPSLPVHNPTKSLWQEPYHERLLGIKSERLPSERDIVIIGSGITSCSVAREILTTDGSCSVTVLEAREVSSGATGRNGGRINCVAVLDYDKYTGLFGAEAAEKIVRFELSHLEELKSVARSLGPNVFDIAELRNVETVATVFTDEQLEKLKVSLANFDAAFPDLAGQWTITENTEKYGIKAGKGALLGKAGAAWPYRLVTAIFDQLIQKHRNRFSIETNTPAVTVMRDASHTFPYLIRTPRGEIRAKHVVHCTEGHSAHLLPHLRGILVPRRGQMSVQNPGSTFEDSQGKRSWSFYFQTGFDYLSQNAHTGEVYIGGGELGGFDSGLEIHGIASDAEENVGAKSHLAGILPVVFGKEAWGSERPGKPLIKASWVGILCNSLDRVPLVGMLCQEALGSRRVGSRQEGAEWISAGYGGYGMVNAWRCAKALAQQVLGSDVPAWLPAAYVLTPARMALLRQNLANVKGSDKHLRALL